MLSLLRDVTLLSQESHIDHEHLAVLDDPAIDAVYIPLPSGLHFEWALKALTKGKHVLLEKPAVVNAIEAEALVHSPQLQHTNAPILLEALHYRFQPTWQYFLSLVDRPNLHSVYATAKLPFYMIPKNGIRFDHKLGGGNMLDLGTYPMHAVRQIIATEPEECTRCDVRLSSASDLCDEAAEASFLFPGGVMAEISTDLRATLTTLPTFKICVVHKEVPQEAHDVSQGQRTSCVRKLTINNFLMAAVWHCIHIEDEFIVRRAIDGQVIKRWSKKQSKKVYTFSEIGMDQPGEPFWTSYRHQLEQFINRIRGRSGSGLWVSNEDSLSQARMIDMAYAKSGLPLRPSSKIQPSEDH